MANSDKNYHFETTGRIYGFSFGPVYKYNSDTKHSIEKFAKSKSVLMSQKINYSFSHYFTYYSRWKIILFSEPTCKNAPTNDIMGLNELEYKVYEVVSSGLNLLHDRFLPFRNKYPSKVTVVQSNINYHHVQHKWRYYNCCLNESRFINELLRFHVNSLTANAERKWIHNSIHQISILQLKMSFQ